MLRFSLRLGLALLTGLHLCVVHSYSALSFSLKTHLWVAQTILDDVKVDCAVRIVGEQYALTSEVCAALRNHPTAFLSGALGPDIYPDLVVGQTTTHPGIQGGWQTDQWLAHTVKSASSPDQLAFAYGYLVHAATDIFAHTYVNNYSGDVFALGDERAVERRHFVLERYIDERLPTPAPDAKTMTVPIDWARDTFIFNNDAVAQYLRTSYAAHLVGMNGVRRSVQESIKLLEEIEKTAATLVARYVAETVDLSARQAFGEVQLQVAREALRLQELRLAEQRRAVDLAEREANRLLGEIRRHEQLIASLTSTADVQRNQARLARNRRDAPT
ncbi:zinc dependent phospholipase C family protein [Bradyrhizobium sp. AUGA SZCCT0283]|uniref:zinc dependent phospholipase C family protein n=1 Tax=Bradyrhizobium sp. AUGA SZCCT0283 TaxID=2807671 RepID=UPI001BA4E01A|nr:zinc dependent phospholipase C family protein [Bradyrhizobium sp. AUGA SZCCT0283]MBR1274265.1 zinc dependent phospholipase C family protein [Bradyrhizobium sp. AUGA SZCCT0283]